MVTVDQSMLGGEGEGGVEREEKKGTILAVFVPL